MIDQYSRTCVCLYYEVFCRVNRGGQVTLTVVYFGRRYSLFRIYASDLMAGVNTERARAVHTV